MLFVTVLLCFCVFHDMLIFQLDFYVCVIAQCYDIPIIGVLVNYKWGCKHEEFKLELKN